MNPEYPIYIVSKGRWRQANTARSLDAMGVPFRMVVEPQEFSEYAAVIGEQRLLQLPVGNHGEGPTIARNFAWDHAAAMGAARHWVMDDNIDGFYRLNRNEKVLCLTGTIFKAAEDFVDRYENVPLAGFNYFKFCKSTDAVPPFIRNTRIYSCLLIQNDAPYRWRGKYNEDTDLSLRVLKDGLCTIQFNAFLQEKVTTQRVAGGNTAEFYENEGTLPKSQYLVDQHPDVASVVWKFNRWHHSVDYGPFKKTPLIRRPGINPKGVNEYGMVMVNRSKKWRAATA